MIYAYSPPDGTSSPWALFTSPSAEPAGAPPSTEKTADLEAGSKLPALSVLPAEGGDDDLEIEQKKQGTAVPPAAVDASARQTEVKLQTMSNLSIILTLMSICLAFTSVLLPRPSLASLRSNLGRSRCAVSL